jgi:hypothetical protein
VGPILQQRPHVSKVTGDRKKNPCSQIKGPKIIEERKGLLDIEADVRVP